MKVPNRTQFSLGAGIRRKSMPTFGSKNYLKGHFHFIAETKLQGISLTVLPLNDSTQNITHD